MWKSIVIRFFLFAALIYSVALACSPLMAFQTARPEKTTSQQLTIGKEIRHELILLPQYSLFDWFEFEVQPDNSVVLRGQVRGYDLKSKAEIAVKSIAGVSRVDNQIVNLPMSPGDDEIRRKIYRAIYAEEGQLFHYALDAVPAIHIIVANGAVSLKGVVDNQLDSDIAGAKASEVPGGFTIKNELIVKKQ
jgi:hypothetical protein